MRNTLALAFVSCFVLLFQPASAQAPLGKLLAKAYAGMDNTTPQTIIVYLSDKNEAKRTVTDAHALVSERSIQRRLKVRNRTSIVDESDLPLTRRYVAGVAANVQSIRHELKWFNAVSAQATKGQIDRLRRLPYVKEVDLVGRWRVDRSKEGVAPEKAGAPPTPSGTTTLDYGTSLTQVQQINVPAVHNLGIFGQGVVIGVFDNGVRLLNHHAFDSMQIIAMHDFVDHKVSVVPNNTSTSFGSHGVNTLSLVGGYAPGQLIGPAFRASYILARTENDSSETPVEEDNWAKGIEWADSIGVDVTSTSLGYLTYDPPYTSWTWQDMDGKTTLITRAADRAVGLGIVVVNAAGNNGANASQNTLNAPADGDSVITIGAVYSDGSVAGFSSVGPTFDGRIKPDIMAMGVSNKIASSTNVSGYGNGSGTSFATPLSAGVAALILCAHPDLTPMQVRDAMRNTASNAAAPNNTYGWGVLNALAAINYFGPVSYVQGTLFLDNNGDGIRQMFEPSVPGITVTLSGPKAGLSVTDNSGRFLFDSLSAGRYAMSVGVGSDFITGRKNPDTVSLDTIKRFSAGLMFGVFHAGSIGGRVFADRNQNGIDDAGDSVIGEWAVYLDGPVRDTTITDNLGNFLFSHVGPGTYAVRQSVSPAWIPTYPSTAYSVTMRSGFDTSAAIEFGNYPLPQLTATMNQGWNLLSIPLKGGVHTRGSLAASAAALVYSFDGEAYVRADSLVNGVGYWVKFDIGKSVIDTGYARSMDTVYIHPGWNMIGTLSQPAPVAGIVQQPDSNLISSFLSYNSGYSSGDPMLQPWKGYWVKAKGEGMLIVSSGSQALRTLALPQATLPRR